MNGVCHACFSPWGQDGLWEEKAWSLEEIKGGEGFRSWESLHRDISQRDTGQLTSLMSLLWVLQHKPRGIEQDRIRGFGAQELIPDPCSGNRETLAGRGRTTRTSKAERGGCGGVKKCNWKEEESAGHQGLSAGGYGMSCLQAWSPSPRAKLKGIADQMPNPKCNLITEIRLPSLDYLSPEKTSPPQELASYRPGDGPEMFQNWPNHSLLGHE